MGRKILRKPGSIFLFKFNNKSLFGIFCIKGLQVYQPGAHGDRGSKMIEILQNQASSEVKKPLSHAWDMDQGQTKHHLKFGKHPWQARNDPPTPGTSNKLMPRDSNKNQQKNERKEFQRNCVVVMVYLLLCLVLNAKDLQTTTRETSDSSNIIKSRLRVLNTAYCMNADDFQF